jgi:hypothetical protein
LLLGRQLAHQFLVIVDLDELRMKVLGVALGRFEYGIDRGGFEQFAILSGADLLRSPRRTNNIDIWV